jgi:hypothetical protein
MIIGIHIAAVFLNVSPIPESIIPVIVKNNLKWINYTPK